MNDQNTLFATFTSAGAHEENTRFGAKCLISSLFRTYYSGQVAVFHPTDVPLFAQKRDTCHEFYVPQLKQFTLEHAAGPNILWQSLVASGLDYKRYDNIALATPYALASRNVDHVVASERESAVWQAGQILIVSRATKLAEFMETVLDRFGRCSSQRGGCACGAPLESSEFAFMTARASVRATPTFVISPYSDHVAARQWITHTFASVFFPRVLRTVVEESLF